MFKDSWLYLPLRKVRYASLLAFCMWFRPSDNSHYINSAQLNKSRDAKIALQVQQSQAAMQAPVQQQQQQMHQPSPVGSTTSPASVTSGSGKTPKMAVALYDYTAQGEGEISIREGENLLVIDDSDPEWWNVRSMKKSGGEGFVPMTYVQLKKKLGDSSAPTSSAQAAAVVDPDALRRQQEEEDQRRIEEEEAEKRLAQWRVLEEQRLEWEQRQREDEELRIAEQELRRKEQEEAEERARHSQQESPPPLAPNRPSLSQGTGASSPFRGLPSPTPRPSFTQDSAPPPTAPRPSFTQDSGPPQTAPRPSFTQDAAPPPTAPRPSFTQDASSPATAPRPSFTQNSTPPATAPRPSFTQEAVPLPTAPRPSFTQDAAPPPTAPRPSFTQDTAPPPIASRPVGQFSSDSSNYPVRKSSLENGNIPAPVIPSRPTAPAAPPMPSRPLPVSAPPIPTRSRAGSADVLSSKPAAALPNMSNIRTWTDRSGTFKVEAEYLHIADNKVHLHKVNGVKIAVPLDKLDMADIGVLAKMPGNEYLASRLASAPVPAPARPRQPSTKVDNSIIEQAAAIRLADTNPADFIYNGFNWNEWLLKAGVTPGDAANYAKQFVSEKMDSSCLSSLQRELLRAMGVSEGDVIRMRNAALDSAQPAPGLAAKAAVQEREAQARNLAMINQVHLRDFIYSIIFKA